MTEVLLRMGLTRSGSHRDFSVDNRITPRRDRGHTETLALTIGSRSGSMNACLVICENGFPVRSTT